ncbi:alpha/beta fold hydrolase [Corynebacterium flavescens]
MKCSLGVEDFALAEAAEGILADLDRLEIGAAHFCGFSLGAMLAFEIAVEHPERTITLTLAAGQVKPPRVLMKIQRALMRLLPARMMSSAGVSKSQLIAVVDAVSQTDFSDKLTSIAAPTLVICGSKDWANLPAARGTKLTPRHQSYFPPFSTTSC